MCTYAFSKNLAEKLEGKRIFFFKEKETKGNKRNKSRPRQKTGRPSVGSQFNIPGSKVALGFVYLGQPASYYSSLTHAVHVSPMAPQISLFLCTSVPSHCKPLWLSGCVWVMEERWWIWRETILDVLMQSIRRIPRGWSPPLGTCLIMHWYWILPFSWSLPHFPISAS